MARIQPLDPYLQKIAIDELGEVPSRIEEDLLALKTWIEQQPHLRARIDDQFLIQYLRGSKYSLEKAKEKIDKFYTLIFKYPEQLSARDVDEKVFREVHNLGTFLPLPKPLHENGPRIVLFRLNYSANKYTAEQVLQPCNTLHEMMIMNDPYACINGLLYIADLGNASANHVLQYTPSIMKRQATYCEKALPIRIKGIIFINVSAVAEQFCKLLMPWLSEKLRKRISICGKDLSNVSERIPLKYFPEEYGGENGNLQLIAQEYNKLWDEYRDYFKQNAEFGTDEHLRPGKPIDFDGLFGMCGSFRKINVD